MVSFSSVKVTVSNLEWKLLGVYLHFIKRECIASDRGDLNFMAYWMILWAQATHGVSFLIIGANHLLLMGLEEFHT